MDAHGPKLSSYWWFGPSRRIKFPLQKLPQETVWPNYRPNCEKNTIGHQCGYIPSEWKPRYRWFGLDGHTYWESDIVVEKLRRIWKFWFYCSLCDNTMGSNHKLKNQHLHLNSLVHTLAGLNENLRFSVQHQELLHIIWFWRLSQYRKIYGRCKEPPQNGLFTEAQPAEKPHRPLQYCHGSEISKVVSVLPAEFFEQ